MDNAQDKVAKGRQAHNTHTYILTGEKSANHKLTLAEVKLIRSRLSKGETQLSLAREFGISQSCVSDVKLEKTYKEGEINVS
jgi:hypothetical protein